MTKYFDLDDNGKILFIEQTAIKAGLPKTVIEKDLWVTFMLQAVFNLPFEDKLVFKGGSSLSKVWGLINRMSEDIDLAYGDNFGTFDGDSPTTKQIKKLRKASSVFVRTALPAKTFLEKAFLLHELFSTDRCANANRKSRHLYDLERMMDEAFARKAVSDDALWQSISHHRKHYTSMKGIDYDTDIRKTILLLPPDEYLSAWEQDYNLMRGKMILAGNAIPFATMLERMQELQRRFRG